MARWSIEMYKEVRKKAMKVIETAGNYLENHDNDGFYLLHDFDNAIAMFGTVCEAIGRIDEAIASLELDGSPKVSDYQDMKTELESCKKRMRGILGYFSRKS